MVKWRGEEGTGTSQEEGVFGSSPRCYVRILNIKGERERYGRR